MNNGNDRTVSGTVNNKNTISPVSGLNDLPHPALVALVEQPVRFVDDEIPQVLQREPGGLREVVQQPPGRSHDDVHLDKAKTKTHTRARARTKTRMFRRGPVFRERHRQTRGSVSIGNL